MLVRKWYLRFSKEVVEVGVEVEVEVEVVRGGGGEVLEAGGSSDGD